MRLVTQVIAVGTVEQCLALALAERSPLGFGEQWAVVVPAELPPERWAEAP